MKNVAPAAPAGTVSARAVDHGPEADVANEPPGELEVRTTVVSDGSGVATGPIWSCTLIAPLALPAVAVCGTDTNAVVVGVQEPNVPQTGVKAAPSTAEVHHGAAQASVAAIAAASRPSSAADCALKSLAERPSVFDGSQARPMRSTAEPREAEYDRMA